MTHKKCPVCGGRRLDPRERQLQGGAAHPTKYVGHKLFFRVLDGLPISATACLDCGYVMLFVDPAELADNMKEDGVEFPSDHSAPEPDVPDAGDDAVPIG